MPDPTTRGRTNSNLRTPAASSPLTTPRKSAQVYKSRSSKNSKEEPKPGNNRPRWAIETKKFGGRLMSPRGYSTAEDEKGYLRGKISDLAVQSAAGKASKVFSRAGHPRGVSVGIPSLSCTLHSSFAAESRCMQAGKISEGYLQMEWVGRSGIFAVVPTPGSSIFVARKHIFSSTVSQSIEVARDLAISLCSYRSG
ncbi:hypothetical protein BDZ45DRAFT_746199 [Acephala macrosclerotiorum]|nr:hypothetical protein BDZ45DRAFT_746199 [Acephala macrosclerotiorum]